MGASSEQQLVNVQMSCKQEWGGGKSFQHIIKQAKMEDTFSVGLDIHRNISKSDMYRFRLPFKLDHYHMIFSPSPSPLSFWHC